ncbi:MAG: LysM peptidoglycan-binding domain-containing protein [Anaeromyxobacter sp.]
MFNAGAGDDVVIGGGGNDTLNGEAGVDVLEGAGGNDTFTGGAGNDVYVFGSATGVDRIVENDAAAGNEDVIRFDAVASRQVQSVERRGNDLVLTFQTGDNTGLRKTEYKRDLLGRVTTQVLPSRTDANATTLQPVVEQRYDRWGNVIRQSAPFDPKTGAAALYTEFKYNANNQVVEQRQPDAHGTGAGPVSSVYFDALGQQVATRDANGHTNFQVWDAGGQLIREIHADYGGRTPDLGTLAQGAAPDYGLRLSQIDGPGTVRRSYDALGNQRQVKDAEGHVTTYGFDRLGRNTAITTEATQVYSVAADFSVTGVTKPLSTQMVYDEAGRKVQQTNGASETTHYVYDLRGNIVETRAPGQVRRAAFDGAGRQVGELDAKSNLAAWGFDAFGRLLWNVDIGGVRADYAYDSAKQLVSKTRAGNEVRYTYDSVGQLIGITDPSLDQVTTYGYNARGLRVLERTTKGGVLYQDNRNAYDNLGRLEQVENDLGSERATLGFTYDLVGNRVRQDSASTVLRVGQSALTTQKTLYFAYDAMNRQILVDGAVNNDARDLANVTKDGGHILAYDGNGNRRMDISWGKQVVAREAGPAYGSSATWIQYETRDGQNWEYYTYDSLNRLQTVQTGVFDENWNPIDEQYALLLDERMYDGASRVVKVGLGDELPYSYRQALTAGDSDGNGARTRITKYDEAGRVEATRVLKPNRSIESETTYQLRVQTGTHDVLGYGGAVVGEAPDFEFQAGYDEAGNVRGYWTHGSVDQFFAVNIGIYGGAYREASVIGVTGEDLSHPGQTVSTYDASGNLTKVEDLTKPANTRTLVNDADGHVLYKYQEGRRLRELVVNGNVLGIFGEGTDPEKPTNGSGNPNYTLQNSFGLTYQPITGTYPAAAIGSYAVQAGDTLRSIAQASYGDASLWYLIADANGVRSDSDLRVGQTLSIPSGAVGSKNTSETYQPYDQSRIVGTTTPNIPMPAHKGCGIIGTILVIVVTAVVSAYTGGAAATALGPFMSSFAAGAVGGAIGAAAGSAAGQIVGMAAGIQESFSWKSVAMGAIGGAVGGAFQEAFKAVNWGAQLGDKMGGSVWQTVGKAAQGATRAVLTNATTQGVQCALGLQKSFSWSAVAGAAIGATLNATLGDWAMDATAPAYGGAFLTHGGALLDVGRRLGVETANGIASGAAVSAALHGKVNVKQVAADAFGNALGTAVVDTINWVQAWSDRRQQQTIREMSERSARAAAAERKAINSIYADQNDPSRFYAAPPKKENPYEGQYDPTYKYAAPPSARGDAASGVPSGPGDVGNGSGAVEAPAANQAAYAVEVGGPTARLEGAHDARHGVYFGSNGGLRMMATSGHGLSLAGQPASSSTAPVPLAELRCLLGLPQNSDEVAVQEALKTAFEMGLKGLIDAEQALPWRERSTLDLLVARRMLADYQEVREGSMPGEPIHWVPPYMRPGYNPELVEPPHESLQSITVGGVTLPTWGGFYAESQLGGPWRILRDWRFGLAQDDLRRFREVPELASCSAPAHAEADYLAGWRQIDEALGRSPGEALPAGREPVQRNGNRKPIVRPYRQFRGRLEEGSNANHLNQTAAYGEVIPREEGLAYPVRGNPNRPGSEHSIFHRVLNAFFAQFKKGGSRVGERPTDAEYNRGLYEALRASGQSAARARSLAERAMKELESRGRVPSDLVPRLPYQRTPPGRPAPAPVRPVPPSRRPPRTRR